MTKKNDYVVEEGEILAVLFEEVPGNALDDIALTEEIAYQWGKELATLHQQSRMDKVSFHRPNYKDQFRWIDTQINEEKPLQKLSKEIEHEFDALHKTNDTYGLCHYDFEMDNVYYEEEKSIFSLIDFDDSMYHFYAIDLEQVMMNLEEEEKSEFKEAFLNGYRANHKLPSENERMLARKFILLLGYAKLSYCLNHPPIMQPEWMGDLIQKLTRNKQEKRDWLLDNEIHS